MTKWLGLFFSKRDDKNLRLILWTIKAYFSGSSNQEDLIFPGYLGYRNAQLFYDPAFGVRFSTYAIASIRSHILNWLRKESRQNFHYDHEINVENRGFSDNQDSFEVQEIIRKTLLTDLEKRIIFLYYFEDLTFRDIEKVLDLSHARIHQILRGSILKMRRLLYRRVNT